ncbi:SEC-C metal-binding domain-containing protein [Bacillus sp. V5-8f]
MSAAPAQILKSNVIDFNSRKTIGRNDPFPCGSGKKYKKCCGQA